VTGPSVSRRPGWRAFGALGVFLSVAVAGGLVLGYVTVGGGGAGGAEKARAAGPAAQQRNGRTLYVSTAGSDKAAGTASAPLRTLRAAVATSRAGDVVVVASGTYDERVDFHRSGTTTGGPITYQAAPGASVVIARGFRVTGDRVVVRDVTVTPGESRASVFEAELSQSSFMPHSTGQIQVTGSHDVLERIGHHDEASVTPPGVSSLSFLRGAHNVVRDIDFHDCGPIYFNGNDREAAGSGRFNTVSGGSLHHTNGGLVMLEADDSTIEDLDLHDPGQRDRGVEDGNAADGIGVNAARVTIRRCAIHRIFAQTERQHSDAIQWWEAADDLTIEACVIGSNERGGALHLRDQGHIEFTSEEPGKTSRRVVIRNNVFLGAEGDYVLNGSPGQTILGQADDWRIVGNTFACDQSIRRDLLQHARGWVIADNVFSSNGEFTDPAGKPRLDYNAYVGCDPSSDEGPHSLRVDALAPVSATAAKWRPPATSRLVGAGVALPELTQDAAGAVRPDPPTIGAYEPAGTGGGK
jgi:hypothetical protein